MLGSYTPGQFQFGPNDGAGGTIITDPPAPVMSDTLLWQPTASEAATGASSTVELRGRVAGSPSGSSQASTNSTWLGDGPASLLWQPANRPALGRLNGRRRLLAGSVGRGALVGNPPAVVDLRQVPARATAFVGREEPRHTGRANFPRAGAALPLRAGVTPGGSLQVLQIGQRCPL